MLSILQICVMSLCGVCLETLFKPNGYNVIYICADLLCKTKDYIMVLIFSDPLCGVTELDPATHVGKNPCNSMWLYHAIVYGTLNGHNNNNDSNNNTEILIKHEPLT